MARTTRLEGVIERYGALLLLLALLLIVAGVADLLATTIIERMAIQLFINLTLVLGLQTFMGNSGILSFASIGFMGIGAYGSSILSMPAQAKGFALPDLYPFLVPIELPFPAAIVLAGLFAALVAALVSLPLMRLSDAAAVITSFALLVVIHNVLVHWNAVTNGPQTFFGVTRHTYLWTAAAWACAFTALAYWFKESSVGLRLRASRDDATAAATIGINIVVVRWIAFTLNAFVAAIGGGLFAHYITSFAPGAFYLKETFVILAMLIVGGPRTVSGAVIGTLVVSAVFEGMRNLENALNIAKVSKEPIVGLTEVVLALVLVAILIWRPDGLVPVRELRAPHRLLRLRGAGPRTTAPRAQSD